MSDQFVVLRVAGTAHGVPVEQVQEVLPWAPVTPVPGVPGWVLGAREVRGEVIPVIDLGQRLGMATAPAGGGKVVIVRCQGQAAGLVVEDVREVVRLQPDQWQAPAPVLQSAVVTGIGRVGDELVLLLDLLPVVQAAGM